MSWIASASASQWIPSIFKKVQFGDLAKNALFGAAVSGFVSVMSDVLQEPKSALKFAFWEVCKLEDGSSLRLMSLEEDMSWCQEFDEFFRLTKSKDFLGPQVPKDEREKLRSFWYEMLVRAEQIVVLHKYCIADPQKVDTALYSSLFALRSAYAEFVELIHTCVSSKGVALETSNIISCKDNLSNQCDPYVSAVDDVIKTRSGK